jgi:hypothetical protein
MQRIIFSCILFVFCLSGVYAQYSKIGEWRSHLSYKNGIQVEEVGDRIFCVTSNGLFYVNKEDKSMRLLSKINGFSDIDVASIRYSKDFDMLFIAYKNTMIDIVESKRISKFTDIFRKYIPGKKTINSICFHGNYAYISCSFGIVVYDMKRREVRETYSNIGDDGKVLEIHAVTIRGDSLFAASNEAVLGADMNNPNLLDYRSWKILFNQACDRIQSFQDDIFAISGASLYRYDGQHWNTFDTISSACTNLELSNDQLILTYQDQVHIMDADYNKRIKHILNSNSNLIDKEGILWHAVPIYTLLSDNSGSIDFYVPNGPASNNTWKLEIFKDYIYVAPGGISFAWGSLFNNDGFFRYDNRFWTNYNASSHPAFQQVRDVIAVKADPVTGKLYLGTFGFGLVEFYNNDIQVLYDQRNSSLSYDANTQDTARISIYDIAFDAENNMWVTNWGAVEPLSRMYASDKQWESFSLGSSGNRNVGKIVIDESSQKWITLPRDGGLIVFDEKRPLNDRYRKLEKGEGKGNLPDNNVYAIARDLDGNIWIGTGEGVAVFYNARNVFEGDDFDARQIYIEDEVMGAGYLLAAEVIQCIEVDGANRKWIGTRNGAWYVSADGTEILLHFNKDNSPLPSDFVRDIIVHPDNGEVFFATDKGLVSYRGTAIEGSDTHSDVYAFPNPVKPDYTGPVAIKGLVRDAEVKITDVAGNLVFEKKAEGGQMVWDTRNFSGKSVKSGVYIIYSSDKDGTETHVCKLLIVR